MIDAESAAIRIARADGWRIRPTSVPFQFSTPADSTAAGVSSNPAGVEPARVTTMQGGPRGSLAMATAPCELGAGTVVLASKRRIASEYCQRTTAEAYSSDPGTRWTAYAVAAGATLRAKYVRMVVVDIGPYAR